MSAALPELGDVIGDRYRLVAVRAQGASSILFEAEEIRDGERIALKVLRPEVLAIPGITARFEREAHLLATLRSPHVVRVLDVGYTSAGLPFLALELLDGDDLHAEIVRRRVPAALAVHWIRQACKGLEEAHARGIVHRDIKPANLFLTRVEKGAGSIKVLDFGISKQTTMESDLTSFGAALGTPVYMPPEQLRSARDADPRSDVWALGVVLYELITGRAPFEGEAAHEVASEILSDAPAPPLEAFASDVPAGLSAVVALALEKDPALRTPTVSALRDALAPFDGARSVAPPPAPPAPPASSIPPPLVAAPMETRPSEAPRPMKRSTFWLAIAAGLLIGSLVILIAILGIRRLRGDSTSPLVAAGVVDPEPTVASVLSNAAPADGRWRPCLLSTGAGPSFPALSHVGKQPEPVADLDASIERRPMLRLEAPWQKGAPSPGELVVSPVTPLGRAFRERPARVVALTNVGLWRASIDDDSWERLGSSAELTGLERPLPAIIVLVEGDTSIRALGDLLETLEAARAPLALAISKRSGSVATGTEKPGSYACPSVRWRGSIPATERPSVEAAVQELGRRCAAAVPSVAGMSMEIVLRSSSGRTDVCIERRDATSVRLENCVVEGAKAIDIAGTGERAGAFRMTFDVTQVRATCAE